MKIKIAGRACYSFEKDHVNIDYLTRSDISNYVSLIINKPSILNESDNEIGSMNHDKMKYIIFSNEMHSALNNNPLNIPNSCEIIFYLKNNKEQFLKYCNKEDILALTKSVIINQPLNLYYAYEELEMILGNYEYLSSLMLENESDKLKQKIQDIMQNSFIENDIKLSVINNSYNHLHIINQDEYNNNLNKLLAITSNYYNFIEDI